MATKEKQKKKNPAGFFERQLILLLNYCYAVKQNPKIPISEIHRKYSTYSKRSSVLNTIINGYECNVIMGPFLFVNNGIEVLLIKDIDNPRQFYENCKKDPKTNLVILSHGHWPIFLCKTGANTLQFHDSILPNIGNISEKKIENIFFEEKGTLPTDNYPHRWFEEHWNTFKALELPRNKKFSEAGKELGVSRVRAREYFLEVLKQCKIITNFFPLGIERYSPSLITFKTDYETGIAKGLKTLNRTTYLYKANNTIILYLYISPFPKEQNHFSDKFQRLQEMGLIRDLHISTPLKWYRHP